MSDLTFNWEAQRKGIQRHNFRIDFLFINFFTIFPEFGTSTRNSKHKKLVTKAARNSTSKQSHIVSSKNRVDTEHLNLYFNNNVSKKHFCHIWQIFHFSKNDIFAILKDSSYLQSFNVCVVWIHITIRAEWNVILQMTDIEFILQYRLKITYIQNYIYSKLKLISSRR